MVPGASLFIAGEVMPRVLRGVAHGVAFLDGEGASYDVRRVGDG
jgi:hypothetical protein